MLCDRCKKDVTDLANSCRELEYEMNAAEYGHTEAVRLEGAIRSDRHIFSSHGCQGSPSRRQYLGGKHDTLHKYDETFAPKIQAAFKRCQDKQTKNDTMALAAQSGMMMD